MKLTVQANTGVPTGGYAAEYIGAEAFENEYGEGVRLKWRILDGQHAGSEASRIVSAKLSPKSNLFKMVKALKGADLAPGEEIDLLSYIGAKGLIVVEETDSGATRVGSFLKQQA